MSTKGKLSVKVANAVKEATNQLIRAKRADHVACVMGDADAKSALEEFMQSPEGMRFVADVFVSRRLRKGKGLVANEDQGDLLVGFMAQDYAVVPVAGEAPDQVKMGNTKHEDLTADFNVLADAHSALGARMGVKRPQLRALEHPMNVLGLNFYDAMAWLQENGEDFTA